ncbi:hypothetical protein SVIO_026800 [Streptomyces violaceusniger]|uniref:Glutamate--cysteine ligase n=1 Tax=Streptomyces violaceusniger TaxID=68280 RepID=A0A4D4KZY2_STRVO|nr:hypothetical protein SVIO_026800 [Streptomyces violaceusniger]
MAELTLEEAEAYVLGVCFKTGPSKRTGVETEWLVQDRHNPGLSISVDRLNAVLAPIEVADALPGAVGSPVSRAASWNSVLRRPSRSPHASRRWPPISPSCARSSSRPT